MSITYNIFKVRIDLDRIRRNFAAVKERCANPIPVIKADAYGHGLIPVAGVLAGAGVGRMAVGTVGEAVDLRKSGFGGTIISLLGPQLDQDYPACVEYDITPFTFTADHLRRLNAAAGAKILPVIVKFDTGMSRLGFAPDQAERVASLLADCPRVKAVMAASHFATADDPAEEAYARAQAEAFMRGVRGLREAGLPVEACMANTGGIFAYPEYHFDAQRPGISLYGCNPLKGTAWEGKCAPVSQAMTVSTRIVSVHDIAAGTSVSYGRTFKAPRDMRIAIAACGYADNYSRGISGKGEMLVRGGRAKICGRVCMQLTAVDVSDIQNVSPGDEVFILGGGPNGVTPDELAAWWGTIPYEVFCLLGQNPREYYGG